MIVTIILFLMIIYISTLLYVNHKYKESINNYKKAEESLYKSSLSGGMIIEHDTYFEVSILKYTRLCVPHREEWITVKSFPKLDDPDFARLQAEELLEKLSE